MPQVELLLLAIRSAIRINEQVRRGFAGMVVAKEIALPLPEFPAAPTTESARNFYETDGATYLVADARQRELYNRWRTLQGEELREFLRRYQEDWALNTATAAPAGSVLKADLSYDDYRALLTVRQWRRGAETTPSLLQRAAGTLIEIAVDYHLQVPGAINPDSSRGKLVKAFLEAIDGIDFAEDAPATIGTKVVDGLFVSVLETLRDHPEIAADGERGEKLMKSVAGDLVKQAQELIAGAPDQLARDRVESFAEALFPGLLRSAASTIVDDPRLYLGLDKDAQAALVSGVGQGILKAAGDEKLELDALFSRETLDAALKAALAVTARYPELLDADGAGTGKLVAAVAAALAAEAEPIGPGLMPELVRLVLEKSAENLDVLLPDKNAPGRHLLVVALKKVLPVLSRPAPGNARWKPVFCSRDALALAEAVADEVVRNPQWVVDPAGRENPLLGEVVAAVLDALRAQAAPVLRRESALAIIAAAVQAVGHRLELGVADPAGKRIVADVVAAVLASVQGNAAKADEAWLFARDEALRRLIDLVLDEIAQAGKRQDVVHQVQDFLNEAVDRIRTGKAWTWDDFARLLREELAKGG